MLYTDAVAVFRAAHADVARLTAVIDYATRDFSYADYVAACAARRAARADMAAAAGVCADLYRAGH
jgi:hypothetical protein